MSFEERPLDPKPDQALRQALDQWPRPTAPAPFRERLRAEFLAAPFVEGAVAEPDPVDLEPAPIVAPRWGEASPSVGSGADSGLPARRPWFTLVAIAAIAAAVLLISRWPLQSRWRVAASSDFTLARIDGREFSPRETARLAAALAPGSAVEVEGGSLDLVLDQRVALSLASGCKLTLVEVPAPEVLDAVWINQRSGSLAVVTGPNFSGAGLRIQTPDTEVRVTGTQFAIDVIAESGTCVCCGEGSVSVFDAPLAENPLAQGIAENKVAHGEMRFVFRDHRPMETGASIAEHIAPIESLRQVWTAAR